jgi:hypothetical protein
MQNNNLPLIEIKNFKKLEQFRGMFVAYSAQFVAKTVPKNIDIFTNPPGFVLGAQKKNEYAYLSNEKYNIYRLLNPKDKQFISQITARHITAYSAIMMRSVTREEQEAIKNALEANQATLNLEVCCKQDKNEILKTLGYPPKVKKRLRDQEIQAQNIKGSKKQKTETMVQSLVSTKGRQKSILTESPLLEQSSMLALDNRDRPQQRETAQ